LSLRPQRREQSLERLLRARVATTRRRRLHLHRRDPPPEFRDLPERVGEPLARLVTVLLRAEQLGAGVAQEPPKGRTKKRTRAPFLFAIVGIIGLVMLANSVNQSVRERAAVAQQPPPPLPAPTTAEYGDLASVLIGQNCIARQMRLQDIATLYEGDSKWEFRWSENWDQRVRVASL
jgi:hypothetical protein